MSEFKMTREVQHIESPHDYRDCLPLEFFLTEHKWCLWEKESITATETPSGIYTRKIICVQHQLKPNYNFPETDLESENDARENELSHMEYPELFCGYKHDSGDTCVLPEHSGTHDLGYADA